jgi:menaquinone-9 beta-reductase
MYDLIVIGGGPAGSSAAITAHKAGARVLLLEKSRFPRHKVCGEFVSGESLNVLSKLLAPQWTGLLQEAIRLPKTRIFLDDRILQTEITPSAASISRFDLDLALWESAQQAGVEVMEQAPVRNISDSTHFHVKTASGDFESRAVIDASGRWSNLTAKSAPFSKEKWLGIKGHFAEKSPSVTIDLYFFDGGYCGVSPVDLAKKSSGERINACTMVRADVATNLEQVFTLNQSLWERSRNWQPLIETVSTSPLIFRDPSLLRGNILLAGDAATFVDPFVGDGISMALRSGKLAAESLQDFFQNKSTLEQVCEQYRLRYQNNLGRIYRASSKIRRMLKIPPRIRKPFVFLLEKSPAATRYLVQKTR